jgi:hypothetical protein
MEECIEISNVEVKAHFAPKKPLPKQVIPLKISQYFVDMLEKKPGHVEALDTDYERSIVKSHSEMRKKKSGKQVPQLREQKKQPISPLKVPTTLER